MMKHLRSASKLLLRSCCLGNKSGFVVGLFLARPRKRPKKKGAAQTPRGLLFRELSLWWKRKLLPCERLGIHEAQVMDGTARKSPIRSAAKAVEARRGRTDGFYTYLL